jgi:hypothetical protein
MSEGAPPTWHEQPQKPTQLGEIKLGPLKRSLG